MKKSKAEKIMAKIARDYEEISVEFSRTRQRSWKDLEKLAGFASPGDRVLDLGCGNGRFFELLESKDVDYIGIDGCKALVGKAREKYGKRGAQFAVGNMVELSFKDNEFDAVFCIAAFHHLPSKTLRMKALSEIRRVLKPKGLLAMTNWNLFQERYFFRLFDFKAKLKHGTLSLKDAFIPWKATLGKTVWRYYRAFSKRELAGLFNKAGFETEEIYYSKKGEAAGRWDGKNLVAIARKK